MLDKSTGRFRISSKAFGPSKSDGSLSGDLEQALALDGLMPTAMYPAVPRAIGAASLLVGTLHDLQCAVSHEPVPTNWYHGGAQGTKRNRVKDKLRDAAEEIIPIDQDAAARWFREREKEASKLASSQAL